MMQNCMKTKSISKVMVQKNNLIILLITTLVFLAFMIWVLPAVSETTREITGTTLSPDTSFFYTAETLYQIASEYGPEGRSYYIRSRFTFDVIWPIVYGAFLISAISMLFKKPIRGKDYHFLNLLPVFGIIFDFLENIGASFVMFRYPEMTIIANWTPYFTLIKWIFIYASFACLLIGLLLKLAPNFSRQ